MAEGEGGTTVFVGWGGIVGGGVKVNVAEGGIEVGLGGIAVSVGGIGVLVDVGVAGGAKT